MCEVCVGVWYMCGRVVHACVGWCVGVGGGLWGFACVGCWECEHVCGMCVDVWGVWMCGVVEVVWGVCGVCVHHSVCECMVNE